MECGPVSGIRAVDFTFAGSDTDEFVERIDLVAYVTKGTLQNCLFVRRAQCPRPALPGKDGGAWAQALFDLLCAGGSS